MINLTPQFRKLQQKRVYMYTTSIQVRRSWNDNETIGNGNKLKLQCLNTVQTTTSHFYNIQESDNDLEEKTTQILNIYEKNPKLNYNSSFKTWCNYCRR